MAVDGRRGDDGGQVVDRRPGPQSEGVRGQADGVAEGWERQYSCHIEGEDGGDGVGDVGIRRRDHPVGGGDRRRSADPGPHADQRAKVSADAQRPSDPDGAEQGHRQGPEEHWQRPGPDGDYLVE